MRRRDPSFGRSLRDARTARGLSQARLAELAGCSEDMVGRVERGRVSPTIALASRLAAALEVDLGELVRGNVDEAGAVGRDLLAALTAFVASLDAGR